MSWGRGGEGRGGEGERQVRSTSKNERKKEENRRRPTTPIRPLAAQACFSLNQSKNGPSTPTHAHPSIHPSMRTRPASQKRVCPPPPWLRSRQPSTHPNPNALPLPGWAGWAGLWELYQSEDRTAHTCNERHGMDAIYHTTPAVKINGWLWLAVAGWFGCLATVRWNTHTNRRTAPILHTDRQTDRKTGRACGAAGRGTAGLAQLQADDSTTTSNHVKRCAPFLPLMNAALSDRHG